MNLVTDDELALDCPASGTFVFRRIETIDGWAPDRLTLRIPPGSTNCPAWDPAEDAFLVPNGRWIVARNVGGSTTPLFWHLNGRGIVDSWDGGAAGPEVPRTVAGWYAAFSMPDTATEEPLSPPSGGLAAGLALGIAAAAGLVASLRRSGTRARTSRQGRLRVGLESGS